VSIIQARIHRIRYVWPFSVGAPIVIRDSGFSLPIDTAVIVQRITWLDPERNSYRAGEVFLSRIRGSNFYRYELDRDDFIKRAMTLDPLSNSSYRVILTRPAEERLIFRVLTFALLSLFVLAAIAAAWDLVIAPRNRRTAGTVSFHEV
jgi:hypothetical protein